ncbi:MAG: Eco57I restriction-modification methylase domain-containing protein, partial [Chloroflexota bacterium]
DLLVSYAMGRSLAAPAPIVRGLDEANDRAARRRFFHWELEFPEVFFDRHGRSLGEAAGFDAVIGNPPYIRQEGLTADKPFLQAAFPEVYHGVADLSVYFFAQALALLRPGGRTSFINSNSWLRANYATPLRAHLRTGVTVEQVIDLGDNRVFADAPDVYPAIHLFSRVMPPAEHTARTAVFGRGEGIADLARQVKEREISTTKHDQDDSGWQLGAAPGRALFAKLMAGGRPLGEVVEGRMYRGVLTGLNEAFIVNQNTRDQLLAADPSCAAVIKPILRGEDLRPWYQEDEGHWMILLPSGWTGDAFGQGLSEADAWPRFQGRYPAIAAHLWPFRDAANRRQDKGRYWWELRSCDYYDAFQQPKILWPDIAKLPRFSWDGSGYYLGNTGYIANTDQPW